MFTKKRLLSVAGTVISIISIVTLPDDAGAWWGRITAIWDMTKGNPVSSVALIVGLALLAWAHWNRIGRLFGVKRWPTDADLGKDLYKWLQDSGFQMVEPALQDRPPKTIFYFVGIEPLSNRPINVIKIEGEPGVRLQSAVVLDEGQKGFFRSQSLERQQAIIGNVGLELARINVSFDGLDIPTHGIQVISGFIPHDRMTSFWFMERVILVSRAVMLTQIVLSRDLPPVTQRLALDSGGSQKKAAS
ncbi:MAG: DUF2299 family protein [Dehalococcoidia bacterium]|nr:DUF2299 family protein [Dehalococcoidia bacterium]